MLTSLVERLTERLALEEGIRLRVYDDATGEDIVAGTLVRGNPTIGSGRNLSGKGISDQERVMLLAHDLADAETEAAKYLWWHRLDDARAAAVVDMIFNLGPEKFSKFTTFIALLARGAYDEAATDLTTTPWYKQVGKRGITLTEQIRTGDWS